MPKGELEAACAVGMSARMILRRIWLPRAIRIGLPTVAGEVILQLKATLIVFSVTVMDLYGAAYKTARTRSWSTSPSSWSRCFTSV